MMASEPSFLFDFYIPFYCQVKEKAGQSSAITFVKLLGVLESVLHHRKMIGRSIFRVVSKVAVT